MFICIYCQKNASEVRPSDAHLFPMAMGGVTFSNNTVCKGCNGLVNREVEMPAINSFALFQSIWGIKGRRSQGKRVPAVARFGEDERRTYLNEAGEPASEIVFESSNDGKKAFRVFGPPEKSKRTRERISSKRPNIQWTEIAPRSDQPLQIVVPFGEELRRPTIRRLAAKIAFERFAQIRSSEFVQDKEYERIRDFILTGREAACCGVVGDLGLLNGILAFFDLPQHAVVVIGYPGSRVLGAFVAIYGLFYFWVLLSTAYSALWPFDDVLIEDPQSGVVQSPVLRVGIGNLVVPWLEIAAQNVSDPDGVVMVAIRYANEKFHSAADKFYGTNEPGV